MKQKHILLSSTILHRCVKIQLFQTSRAPISSVPKGFSERVPTDLNVVGFLLSAAIQQTNILLLYSDFQFFNSVVIKKKQIGNNASGIFKKNLDRLIHISQSIRKLGHVWGFFLFSRSFCFLIDRNTYSHRLMI